MTTSVLEDRPTIGKNLDDAPYEYARLRFIVDPKDGPLFQDIDSPSALPFGQGGWTATLVQRAGKPLLISLVTASRKISGHMLEVEFADDPSDAAAAPAEDTQKCLTEKAPQDDKSLWYCHSIEDVGNGKNEVTLMGRFDKGVSIFEVKQGDPDLEQFYVVGKTYNLFAEHP